jgi:hypothetical protein
VIGTKLVFCRNGFEYTDVYATLLTPHVAKLLRGDTKSCILDGEMMGWNKNFKCYKYKGKRRIVFLSAVAINFVLFMFLILVSMIAESVIHLHCFGF